MADRRRALTRALLAVCALALAVAAAPAAVAAPKGPLSQARDALHHWKLGQAEQLLSKAGAPAVEVERQTLLARLDLQRSRFKAVVERLTPLVAKHPGAYEARVVLGRALKATGDKARAFAVLDPMANDYNDGRIATAADKMWLAVGLHLTGYHKDASSTFAEALADDASLHTARLRWADLFIDKYNFKDSDALFKEVLARRANDPEARLGLARLDVESDREYAKAAETAEALVRESPTHVPAHNLLARIALDNERPEEAIARLQAHSLKVAPDDPEAIALLGAAHYIADDEAAYRKTERRALAVNPKFARFYTVVADHATRMHRYKESLALADKALSLDREHWPAYAALGIGYSRVGDDAKAKEFLDKAYDGDPYDVRTYNLLEFFYDRVIKQFEWMDAGKMRVRVHKPERPVLERYVPALLKEAYGALSKKYGFEPEAPLHIEIFPDPQLFAVRSIGLPNLGAHGICFGHVITSRSPSDGNFNWAEVLWHELSHVFHIQLSNSRVPRWFTEGMAVYESTEGRPEWRREMDRELLTYFDKQRLRGVAEFNLSFTQARSFDDILVAYYHAFVMAEFIAQEFGFPKMRGMLVAWGQRKATPQVFREVLGVKDLADFDRRFFAWLDQRLSPLRKSYHLDVEQYASDPAKYLQQALKEPTNAAAQAAAAVASLATGDIPGATRYAEAALAIEPARPDALMLRAIVRLRTARRDDAKRDLERLVELGHDGADVRKYLAELAREAGDVAGTVPHLEKAVQFHPQDASLHYELIRALDQTQRPADAFVWRKRVLALDQMNAQLVAELLAGAEAHGATREEILRWGELGNHIAPFSVEHHVAYAKALARLGLTEQARFEASSALLIDPNHAEAKALAK